MTRSSRQPGARPDRVPFCCIARTARQFSLLAGLLGWASGLLAALPFGGWTDGSHAVDTGLAAELLPVEDESSLILHDRQTLVPRLILRDGSRPVMFAPDGDSLFTTGPALRRVDLESGVTTRIGEHDFFAHCFYNPEQDRLLAIVAEPNLYLPTALRLIRYDLAAGSPAPVTELARFAPIELGGLSLTAALPSRLQDHALLVLRDVEATGDAYDPQRWGDYQFVHLDLNSGRNARLSVLPVSSDGMHFDNDNLHWTSPAKDMLHVATYPSEHYHLIDPYQGKFIRQLQVPNVTWNTHDPRYVIALRHAEEDGQTQLYRDYLEPGTLKTIRNVPIADENDFPELPDLGELPQSHWLLSPRDAEVVFVQTRPHYEAPYQIQRIDTSSGTPTVTATFDSATNNLYRYGGFAFHPAAPEFFAHTGSGDVHFFRFTDSGLKRQIRGSAATTLRYTPDGESVLSTEFYEGAVSVTPAASLPFEPAFSYEFNHHMVSTLPEYYQGSTLSPDHQWIIIQSSTFSNLHRFGEAPIVAELPFNPPDLPDAYAFAPDSAHLARLVRAPADEDTGDAPPAQLSVFNVATFLAESYRYEPWTFELPHDSFRLVGWNAAGEIILLDASSAALVCVTPAQDNLRRVPLPELEGLTDDPPYFDPATQQLALRLSDGLALLSLNKETPAITRVELDSAVTQFHRLNDGTHLVAELTNGSLALISLTTDRPQLAAMLEFYNEGADYLLRTPSGQFDATRSLQVNGVMLRGYVPVRLAQIIGQAYTPDLFNRLFAGLPLADTTLPDVVRPPTAELTARISPRSALRAELRLRADSRVDDLAELRLYQNDKLVHTFPPSYHRGANIEHEIDLLLVPENTFRLVAVTTNGLESLPVEATLRPPEAELRRATAAERPAELHLLVVGVNEYRNPEYNLNFAEADAAGLLAKLEAANRPLFARINPIHLASAAATHDGILAAFARVRASARPQDAFVFYFAGHGVMAKTENQFYLVPHDVTRIYGASQSLAENGISADALRDLSAGISAQKQLFILDACNSGGALETFANRGASQEKALAQLARATGTHWITASAADQFATEFADLGHGAFTHTLLEALDGRADTGDRRVTVNELKAFLESELPAVSQRFKGAPQYPSSYGYGQDFPIALLP